MQVIEFNIGTKQRTFRNIAGLIVLVFALGWSILAIISDWDILLRGFSYILYVTAILSILEGRTGVCSINAVRDSQSMSGWFSTGQEKVEDPEKSRFFRKSAFKITVQSLVIAVIPTVLVLLL